MSRKRISLATWVSPSPCDRGWMRDRMILLLLGLFVGACAEASNTTADGGSGGSGGNGGATTTSNGGGGAGGQTTTSNGGSGGETTTTSSGGSGGMPVVVNEIRASDGDYVELMNTGSTAFDLSDYALADSLDDGTPKIDEAARFPAGTTIGPFEHLLVVADQDPAVGVGPHDVCLPDGGPTSCYYSPWGISDGNGDTIFLLSPDDEIVAEGAYPAAAAPAGSTWGRLPDGTGDFAVNAPTPGEPNKAP